MAGKSVKVLHSQVCYTDHRDNSKTHYNLWAFVEVERTNYKGPKVIKTFNFKEELEIHCALHHYELMDLCDFYKQFRCFGKSKALDFIVKNRAFMLVTKKVAKEGHTGGFFWHRVKEEYKAIITPPTTSRQQEDTNNAHQREADQTPQ